MVAIWGLNFVVIHVGLASVPPILFATIRFTVILPMLLVVKRPAVPWPQLAAVGLLMSAGQFGLLYTAMGVGLPAGLASLVLQAQVLFTVGLAMVALRERPRTLQLVGVGVGVLGLSIVAIGRQVATLLGLLLALAAAFSWAAGNIAARRIKGASGLGVTVWGSLFVPLPLLALSLLLEGPAAIGAALTHFPLSAALSTLYTAALSTLFCYAVWNMLLARYPAAEVAPFTLLVPVIGIVAAGVLLGERPNAAEAIGGVVLLAGVGTPLPWRRLWHGVDVVNWGQTWLMHNSLLRSLLPSRPRPVPAMSTGPVGVGRGARGPSASSATAGAGFACPRGLRSDPALLRFLANDLTILARSESLNGHIARAEAGSSRQRTGPRRSPDASASKRLLRCCREPCGGGGI